MHKVKEIQCALIDKLYSNLDNLFELDTEELGEVVDMIKDLGEVRYYNSFVKGKMHKTPEEYLQDLEEMVDTATEEQKSQIHQMLKGIMTKLEK